MDRLSRCRYVPSAVNKTQIIAPLVALGIVALVAAVVYGRRQHEYYLSARAVQIGNELIATTNSQSVVRLGTGLENKLSQFLASPAKVASAAKGDARPPIGDGKAKVVVVLRNSTGELLGIRLRPSKTSDKFEILGFWTPPAEEVGKGVQ